MGVATQSVFSVYRFSSFPSFFIATRNCVLSYYETCDVEKVGYVSTWSFEIGSQDAATYAGSETYPSAPSSRCNV